jgi:NTE family protein/lysophospholipid hydrolase
MFPQDKLGELSATPFFASLSPATINELSPQLELTRLPGGEILFCTGDAGDSMYVVLSGRLRIALERNQGKQEIIREISRGETVGELALLTGEPRSATVHAIRDTELVKFSRGAFERAVKSDPRLIGQIAVQLADRQRQGNDSNLSRRNIRTIAVLPFDVAAPAHELCAALADAMKIAGATLHLTQDGLTTIGGVESSDLAPHASNANETGARLSELERSHRLIVYESDIDFSPWTQRCIRQADLILLVASANAEPTSSRLRTLKNFFDARGITARIELTLVHPRDFDPRAEAKMWLAALPAAAHHHVALSDPGDIAGLVRLLTGTAIGLVLSGGGARGFAHIGVIRAMQERGIPIDYIGGTSMGAVIAAQFALGWDWQRMARVNRDEWPRCEPQKNYTLPLVALNSARRMDQMLRRMFGTAEIQNLRTKFFCVSTNLTTAAAKIHQQGALWKAVRASVSIPGIGPPAIENGEILVDGGLVDNLPVEAMKKLCQGQVFAVDVSEQVEFKSTLQESYTVSGWKLLWQQLNPFSETPDLPNILNTLYRTTTVGSIRQLESAKAIADFCFNPPVSEFGIFDWRSVDKIVDAGYRYAQKKLETSGNWSTETESVAERF